MDKELEVRLQFLEEAQEYLDTLEAVVLGLSATGVDPQKIDGALRAAHSIKGGAALMQFHLLSHTAHRLEDAFKILKARRPEVTEELENLLLSALDSLRQIIELSRRGQDPDEDQMAQPASPILDQLQDILGELQPEDETTLASQESGHDLVKLFFESEVEQSLLRLEAVLAKPDQPCLESELTVLAQELGGLGDMLQLSKFSSLCLSIAQCVETYPRQIPQIATLALGTWRQAQALVLIGQPDLMCFELDYHPSPSAAAETAAPALDIPASQQSELELLLAGFEFDPMESLFSAPEAQKEAQPELALEHWPELESLLSELKAEGVTPGEVLEEVKKVEPQPSQLEANTELEALLMGLDLDLFQTIEAAPPVQPLAEAMPEDEWADLDSLFAALEAAPLKEAPSVVQKPAEIAETAPTLAAPEFSLSGVEGLIEPVEPAELLPILEIETIPAPAVQAEIDAQTMGTNSIPAPQELDLASLFDPIVEPLVLAEEQAPISLAIPETTEFISEFSEETGLDMLAAIFDIGVEAAPSEPIALAEEETLLEIEPHFLEVFNLEAAAPVVFPEVLEVSPDLASVAEPEVVQDLVAETVLEVEQAVLLPEITAVSPETDTLDIAAEHTSLEEIVAAPTVAPAQPALDDEPLQWAEIAAFMTGSVIASTVPESVQPLVEVEAAAPLELQQVERDPVEHEIPEEIVAETILIPELQEVFALEEPPVIELYETSEISVEPQALDIAAKHEILEEQVPAPILRLLPEVTETNLESYALDLSVEPEIVENLFAETILDAEQPAEEESSQWLEIAAFVKVPQAELTQPLIVETIVIAEEEAFELEVEQPALLPEVKGASLESHALDIVAEHETVTVEEQVSETILASEQPAEEESSEWFEVAAFVKISQPELTQSLAAETIVIAEEEAFELELEQPALLPLPETSEISLEFDQEYENLEAVTDEEFVTEIALELEQAPQEESVPWSEIAAFVAGSAVAGTLLHEAAEEPVAEVLLETVLEIQSVQDETPKDEVATPNPGVLEKSILPKRLENASSSSSQGNTVRIPAKRLDQLDDLCGDLTIERNGLALYLGRLHNLVTGLNSRIRNLEQFNLRLRSAYDQEANQANNNKFETQAATTEENFDVLEMDRYSELHMVWQEVMESIVQIQEVTSDIDLTVRNADDTAADLNRTAKQLQSNVMYSRMRPLSDVVGRFPRAIRDLAQQFGKPTALKIQGGSTLIDRTVLGILGDPLMHLLRNAFDHGLEDPDTRIVSGKPAQGTIEIQAYYRGNETIITVSDDGGGISLEKIRNKAIRMGFDQDKIAQAGPQDLLDLIFEPGFSTAEKVTELSGRGVGMDVVRTNLQQVRGKITVNTEPGVGTTFTLSVPVTLSVGRVLLVESQNVMLAFPVDAIEQMALLEEDDDNSSDIFQWENYAVPKLSLKKWLNFHCPVRKIETDDTATMVNPTMLILSQGNNLVGVPIERCWGEREVAIRQAEGPMAMPPGFSGCTILGTGQVVPLVSIPGLFTWIANQEQAPKTEATVSQPQSERETILVIDDSINVRRFLALTLEKAGYRVAQAKDGQDAIEQLTSGLVVDAVICDIEMPRLDGFGFLAQVKANPSLKRLPITMLTSRSGDKHRQLALRLGASEYFSKPFKEQELLQALKQLIQSTQLTPTS
jgi:chemotaxis protein histidine kinase CheA/ActR/RegA family two-component response regulator